MFDSGVVVLDWLGVVAFTITGALVASRNQMDAVGFVLLGTVTGIGGGTLRDLLLGIVSREDAQRFQWVRQMLEWQQHVQDPHEFLHGFKEDPSRPPTRGVTPHPILWVERPAYLVVCIGVSFLLFFTAHLVHKRYRLLLWADAVGLTLFATVGAERAISAGAAPIVAVTMGVITACFGGIIRDVLGHQRSIIFTREIYVTAAMAAALAYVSLNAFGVTREVALTAGLVAGFGLRGSAIFWGWSLPRYHSTSPRSSTDDRPDD